MTSPFYEILLLNCHCSPGWYCTSCQQTLNHSVYNHYSKTQEGSWGLVIQDLGWEPPAAGGCLIGSPSSTFPNNPCPTFEVLCLGGWWRGGAAERRIHHHTYSWRGGLRASCYDWVMKSSSLPPSLKHTHTLTTHWDFSLGPYLARFEIPYGSDPLPHCL